MYRIYLVLYHIPKKINLYLNSYTEAKKLYCILKLDYMYKYINTLININDVLYTCT